MKSTLSKISSPRTDLNPLNVALRYAHQSFDETPQWDIVSATAAIGSFARRNLHHDAIAFFSRLQYINLKPNEFTFGTVLSSSAALRDVHFGKQLHSSAIKTGFHSDTFVGSSLVNLYAKSGSVEETQLAFGDTREPTVVSYTALVTGYLRKGRAEDALLLFRQMPQRNAVSWNAVIGGCSRIGLNEKSVNLFVEMCREGIRPTASTFPCVMTAASHIAVPGLGRSFHASAIKFGYERDVYVGNSLISLYSKSGCSEDGVRVFDRMPHRNVVSWNAMIYGFARDGKAEEALEFYKKMRVSGLRPNGVTLLAVLFGCNHAGLVVEGYECFKLARKEEPSALKAEHYACVVDLLSRSGQFEEAERFVKEELPFEPGIGFWKALLGGSVTRWRNGFTDEIVRKILALDPKDVSSYVMLSNVYACSGNWEGASMIRREMKEKGMKRTTGCSWIEIGSAVHVFSNGDVRHPQTEQVHMVLKSCLSDSNGTKSPREFMFSSAQQSVTEMIDCQP